MKLKNTRMILKIFKLVKKPSFLLIIILATFLIKGLFLAGLFPIFSGQDESRHYNTIQYKLEPKTKTWNIDYENNKKIKGFFSTYNYSEEIRKTAEVIENNSLESTPYDVLAFNNGYTGKGENEINSNQWSHYNKKYPPDITNVRLYHLLSSYIEKFLSSKSILTRFFLIRIAGVILGTLAVYLFYLIARNIGFNQKRSLILTAIISFQPAFSAYYVSINYDVLLILVFALFTLGGVLFIKNGFDFKNALMMISAVIIGLLTKDTAIILLAMLLTIICYTVYKKYKAGKFNFKYVIFSIILISLILFFFFQNYGIQKLLPADGVNLLKIKGYLSDSLGLGRISLTSNSYWGNLSWESNLIADNLIKFIWLIDAFAIAGIILLVFAKNRCDYLPEKKYIIFLALMIIFLQLGIRYADFTIFSSTGELNLGAPGRYFLPNIASHMILFFTGIGALLRKNDYFDVSLKIGLILMISYCIYIIFDILIPRFYL